MTIGQYLRQSAWQLVAVPHTQANPKTTQSDDAEAPALHSSPTPPLSSADGTSPRSPRPIYISSQVAAADAQAAAALVEGAQQAAPHLRRLLLEDGGVAGLVQLRRPEGGEVGGLHLRRRRGPRERSLSAACARIATGHSDVQPQRQPQVLRGTACGLRGDALLQHVSAAAGSPRVGSCAQAAHDVRKCSCTGAHACRE